MVFGKIKSAVFRIFKRGHPDIYTALKDYCKEHNLDASDVVASSIAAWMASNEDSKAELEEHMKARRIGTGGGRGDIKAALGMFKEVCGSMGEMFTAMNEARAGMSISAMLSDFEAVSQTIEKMKGKASEAGKGSIEDLLLSALLSRILPTGSSGLKKKTGTGKIKKVEG